MRNAVIIDSVRTAVGRMGGTLKDVEVDYLAAKFLDEILVRTGIDKSEVDEMERRGEKYGLVTFCIGGGLGITSIVENMKVC